jgi:hypothetical protein
MATNYGTDTFWLNDAPLISVPTSDPFLVVGQRIVRRLTTPRGGLSVFGGDPDFGWDIRQYVLGRVSPAKLGQAEAQVAAEVAKDEAVESATAKFVYTSNGNLTITVQALLAVGPLSLVLNVSALDVSAEFNF